MAKKKQQPIEQKKSPKILNLKILIMMLGFNL